MITPVILAAVLIVLSVAAVTVKRRWEPEPPSPEEQERVRQSLNEIDKLAPWMMWQ